VPNRALVKAAGTQRLPGVGCTWLPVAVAGSTVFTTSPEHRVPPFNITFSNVVAANVPVFRVARLLEHYRLSVITDGQALENSTFCSQPPSSGDSRRLRLTV